MAVAAACFRAKLVGEPGPAGERTARVLAGYRRTTGHRGGRGNRAAGGRDEPGPVDTPRAWPAATVASPRAPCSAASRTRRVW